MSAVPFADATQASTDVHGTPAQLEQMLELYHLALTDLFLTDAAEERYAKVLDVFRSEPATAGKDERSLMALTFLVSFP